MQISGIVLKVAVPSNLDEQLRQTTGCSLDEWKGMLRHSLTPSHVAKVLLPLIEGDISLSELGRAIKEHGVNDVRATVAALLAKGTEALEELELQQPVKPAKESKND